LFVSHFISQSAETSAALMLVFLHFALAYVSLWLI